ncbi:MAG: DUF4340 domain-containing protein, partial [Planctomycetaceae bacterium]|nr:DUF4340 domain-containing protein [Planctomycetaceae bacterium]
NYPADGKDRLAKCAASVIGLKRETLAGQRDAEHPEFDVVDPFDEKSDSLKRGQRIALKDESGKVLADYIVGKQVPSRSGYFYVRRPDEKATYIAKISLDLSTKFADWIEPDLLKLDAMKLNSVEIDNYSIDTDKGRILGRDQSNLSRKTSSEPWKLDGLDEATEEVNQDEVRKMVDGLDNLKIVGVRPKPAKLQRDLKLEEGIKLDQATMIDLGMKGFLFARGESGGQQMVSKEGEVVARTDQGVQYQLHFGDVFSGTEEEIEFGFTKPDEPPAEDAEKKPEDDKKSGVLKKSRYLFVTVSFSPEGLGEQPTEPTKPEAPEEPTAEKPASRAATDPADATVAENVGPWSEYNAQKSAYDLAAAGFEGAKSKYEADLKAREEKVKAGEKIVKDLNHRFADWYYVISGDSFENLRQGRKTLVKPKSQTPGDQGTGGPVNPLNFNFPK